MLPMHSKSPLVRQIVQACLLTDELARDSYRSFAKHADNDELKTLVRRALDVTRLARENRYLTSELRSRYALESVVAESRAMQDALDLVRRAARG